MLLGVQGGRGVTGHLYAWLAVLLAAFSTYLVGTQPREYDPERAVIFNGENP